MVDVHVSIVDGKLVQVKLAADDGSVDPEVVEVEAAGVDKMEPGSVTDMVFVVEVVIVLGEGVPVDVSVCEMRLLIRDEGAIELSVRWPVLMIGTIGKMGKRVGRERRLPGRFACLR